METHRLIILALTALLTTGGAGVRAWAQEAVPTAEVETKTDDAASKENAKAVERSLELIRKEKERIRYESGDKRDPFIPLIRTVKTEAEVGPRPEGFPGLTVAELAVKGVWLSQNTETGGNVAFLVGPDGRSYMQRVGDRSYNGKIIAIGDNYVTFEEYQYDFNGRPRPPKIVRMYVQKPKGELIR